MELAAILVGLYVANIYHRQLTTMEGQLSEMQGSGKQTDRLLYLYQQQLAELKKQSADTHNLAAAAGDQALASQRAATAMAHQVQKLQAGVEQTSRLATASENQTRPWVGVEGTAPADFASESIQVAAFKIKLRNYGQSPALGLIRFPQFKLVTPVSPNVALFDEYRICEETGDVSVGSHTWTLVRLGLIDVIPPGPEGVIVQSVKVDNPGGADLYKTEHLILGCIAYTGLTGTVYHTRLMYSATYTPVIAQTRQVLAITLIYSDFK